MKRKITALIIALTLVLSLSACGDKTPVSTDTTETASVAKTEEIKETKEIKEETEEDLAQKEIEKVQSALGEMPYYGNTSNCKMTAEQATAFAQLIADGLAGDFSFRGGYDEGLFDILSWGEPFQVFDFDMRSPVEVNRFNVMLGDFSGDGVPYLYVYSSVGDDYSQSYEIYGWEDNTAKLVFDTDKEKSGRESFDLYEDENEQSGLKMDYVTYCPPQIYYQITTYAFADGAIKTVRERTEELNIEDNLWHIIENGTESVYTEEEYNALMGAHNHTLPYTCFYDMTPCTLEEMVNYLNAYASAMSDGQSVPVEIKKSEFIKHDGTGISTKGEIPQWKIDNLEILRQYIIGERLIASGNADSTSYLIGGIQERFHFGLADVNNDGIQELLLSYGGSTQIHFPPSYNCLMNVCGIDNVNGTYMVSEGSVSMIIDLYTYDGTSFSVVSSLRGDYDSDWKAVDVTLTENETTRELSTEEFEAVMNDWNNRHTDVSKWADTHLDIENIENTFHVKINVQNSGEWLVTDGK